MISLYADTVTFESPSVDQPEYLKVELMHVRASDGIRIHYDFERDGWAIEQPSVFEWKIGDEICDRGWTEVAFIKSWGLERKVTE